MEHSQTQPTLPWQGFHHIALISADLDATVHFYRDIVGMQAADIMAGKGARGRHCFIKPGETSAWGLHFIEHKDAQLVEQKQMLTELLTKPEIQFTFLSGALQHIAFAMPDEACGLALRTRLEAYNVAMTPINAIATIRNFIFLDNNGIMLEAAWPNG